MYVFLMSSQVMLMLLAQGHTLQITILRNLFLERVNHLESSLAIKVGDQWPETMGNCKEQHWL